MTILNSCKQHHIRWAENQTHEDLRLSNSAPLVKLTNANILINSKFSPGAGTCASAALKWAAMLCRFWLRSVCCNILKTHGCSSTANDNTVFLCNLEERSPELQQALSKISVVGVTKEKRAWSMADVTMLWPQILWLKSDLVKMLSCGKPKRGSKYNPGCWFCSKPDVLRLEAIQVLKTPVNWNGFVEHVVC